MDTDKGVELELDASEDEELSDGGVDVECSADNMDDYEEDAIHAGDEEEDLIDDGEEEDDYEESENPRSPWRNRVGVIYILMHFFMWMRLWSERLTFVVVMSVFTEERSDPC